MNKLMKLWKHWSPAKKEFVIISTLSVLALVIIAYLDVFDKFVYWYITIPEPYELEEIIPAMLLANIGIAIFAWRRWQEIDRAMAEIRELKGIMPICATCKKIRDDKGYWHQVEVYIRDHSDAEFTHSICPDCAQKVMEKLDNMKKKDI